MKRLTVFFLTLALGALSACSSTKTAVPTSDQSGFFKDYSALRSGKAGEPLYVYKLDQVQMRAYDKVLLEPVQVRRGEQTREEGISQETVQYLADYFYTLIYARLARDYEMVTAPDTGTLRIRVAFTRIGEDNIGLDVTSTTRAQPNLIPRFKEVTDQPPRFSGRGSIEVEVLDAQTGTLLWAGIEEKRAASSGDYTWDDLEKDLKYDAERLGFRLCEERGAEGCVRPVRGR